MKRIISLFAASLIFLGANAQKFITKNGYVGFFSHTALEDIKADNNQVASVLDISTGDIIFQLLVKSFSFEKTLMQEHFNENYIESEKYPKSTFKGKISNLSAVDFSKPGKYDVIVEGDLNIHDVTNKISVKGIIEVVTGGIIASSKFSIVPEDYKITIPGIVRENIAKNMEVTVAIRYAPAESK